MKLQIVFLFCSYFLFLNSTFAENICENNKLQTKVASASLWDNYRENPGSIAKESGDMLKLAMLELKKNNKCNIVFTSIPNKFLSDYSDKDYCEKFFKQTKENPIKYRNIKFNNIEEFSSWYNEFSQGKGKEGKDLYNKCDKSCSPQYKSIISQNTDSLNVEVEVVCGAARDKDENNYILGVTLAEKKL